MIRAAFRLLHKLVLNILGRRRGLEGPAVRKLQAIVGVHVEPDLARLGIIAPTQRVEKALLRRFVAMEE